MGSPPQVRGKLVDGVNANHGDRITPAGAGKTPILIAVAFGLGDHPRRCGENEIEECATYAKQGSPPQVRGKPLFFKCIRSKLRITPAGAGKTSHIIFVNSPSKDHPRRCGENNLTSTTAPLVIGSPPQVRGKQQFQARKKYFTGITPAGAGKTSAFRLLRLLQRDHPRRCGENNG